MSTYRMSATQVVARVLRFKRDKKTGEEIFSEEVWSRENKNILEMGYEEWLKTQKESKASFIRKLNKDISPVEPITDLVVEYAHA